MRKYVLTKVEHLNQRFALSLSVSNNKSKILIQINCDRIPAWTVFCPVAVTLNQ